MVMELTREAKDRRYIIITLMALIIIIALIPFIFGCTTQKRLMNHSLPGVKVTAIHESSNPNFYQTALFMVETDRDLTYQTVKMRFLKSPAVFHLQYFITTNLRFTRVILIINDNRDTGILITQEEISRYYHDWLIEVKSKPQIKEKGWIYY